MSRFTDEQLAAIQARGKTIVSASAGSGKTTVMIQKIINLILDGHSVNEILAVTFTKKAAAQMKEKLRKALVQTINDSSTPQSRRAELKKQLDEVSNADISTIHSFCSKLIRTHFYAAGVDNGFRVINDEDAEGVAMKNAALDELLEEGYEQKDEGFMRLLSVYWRKKSDNTFRSLLLSAYKEVRNRADYREYLQDSGKYDEETFEKICADLHALLRKKCGYYLSLVEAEKAYFESEGEENATPTTIAALALATELDEFLTAILESQNYFVACGIEKPKFTAKKSSKKDSEEKKLHIERLAALKGKITKIYDDELSTTKEKEEELTAFLSSGEIAALLSKQLLIFDEKYEAEKRERGALDYNDLEHKALALLNMDEVAVQMREKYRYVFVDEYQDVNPVQEALISKIGGENLFLVGDVKQSIYGFRGSKSKFFVEKQNEFASLGESLVMRRNFRSSDKVLDAVNAQFSLAMTKENCSVDYARDSYMERGGRYALNDGRVELHYLNEEEKEEKKTRGVYSVRESSKRQEKEVSLAVKTLKTIIEKERASKWYDADTGEYRDVRYSDIAILSRKKQGQIALNVAALAAEGIPVTTVAAVNVCDYAEVKTLIDILSLIDNEEQDVPLCSALLSTLANLTADDLAEIRLAEKEEKYFRNACKKYAAKKENELAHRLIAFFAYLKELQTLSCVMDAGELLAKIIADTRMETRLLSMENGVSCLKRIHRFIEEASNPEPLCVHEFLERLRDLDYRIEFSENGGEDSVKVLTMHSSKGLEYPVVILDNLNAPFRAVDSGEILIEETYGLAPRAFDENKMTKTETLLRRLQREKEQENSTADELNLYYVALTRAKYALHLIFKKSSVLPDTRYARSFADFTDFSVWEDYEVQDTIFDVPRQERSALAYHPDEELARSIVGAFSWEYPNEVCENLPVKDSATGLMSSEVFVEKSDDSGFGKIKELSYTLFDGDEQEYQTTDREIGIAYHAFLERFDFACLFDEDGNRIERGKLAHLVENTLAVMEEELSGSTKTLSQEKLIEILSASVFTRLYKATLYKERQFLVSLPVCDTYALRSDADERLRALDKSEEMIFQGAIDLLAVKDGCVWIIDYKYSKRGAESLRVHYKPQLDLYRKATAKILGIKAEDMRCTIVNICRGYEVEVD